MHLNYCFAVILTLHFMTVSYCFIHNNKLPSRHNVVLVLVDDLRHLSDENVNLPNIHKLAKTGIHFKNAFAQQSLCAPSRNSLLTGRRPDSLRLYDFYSYWRETVGNFTTLPQLFKQNGYHTYSVGKVFHPGVSSGYTDDYPYSWSTKPYHPPSEVYKNSPVCYDILTKKLQKNLICPVDVFNQPRHTLPDIQILNRAVNVLNKVKKSEQPFLLAVGFHKPHIPFKFPMEYLDVNDRSSFRIKLRALRMNMILTVVPYQISRFGCSECDINGVYQAKLFVDVASGTEKYPLDSITPKHPFIPKGMPLVSYHPWTDIRERDDIMRLNLTFPFATMPELWSKKIIQGYYASASFVDDLIGQLIRNVDLENTVVVLTSDHGWSLGENGLWAKYSNFDVALKVPLIFHYPNVTHKEIDTPVELIDIFPTIADIAGFKNIPKCNNKNEELCFDGKNILKHINNNIALSQYPRPSVYPKYNSDKPKLKDIRIMGYSIRTNRFRFTMWVDLNNTNFVRNWSIVYGTELYDHNYDKYETKNLYNFKYFKDLCNHFCVLLRNKVEGYN